MTTTEKFAAATLLAEQAARNVAAAQESLRLAIREQEKAQKGLLDAAMALAEENARKTEAEKAAEKLAEERDRNAARLAKEREKHAQKLAEVRARAAYKVRLAKEAARAATKRVRIRTEDGTERDVSPAAFQVVKKALKSRASGILSPLDGDEAQGVLRALDEGGNVGDSFTLIVGAGVSQYRVKFLVEGEGLSFKVSR
jgi:membrane protein involved in colicin uptake